MHAGGCLVAMWVTNRERHRRFIEQELLPGWGLRHLATWHWLKVTDGGQPVGRLDIEHRRPYESLLLCWPAHLPDPPGAPAAPAAGGDASGGSCFHVLREPLVVVAVPPASHSRKPHLGPLLLPLLPDGARCLEMFARELHSGWTSWGNEGLKFQSKQRFQRRRQ
ncbi:hypothetical protein CHLNCDRAFT_36694 [Chlorella variabilis]|uniref:Uncharacterized protein n=1 Tax=Chlorella variabilis TaxID=554065 RepID=E1ZMR3_CHLVA|nr:hypothetical protein CHLNCDRAFT_36694 [Chlorella variabilis]EFN52846.1 hypothetical protein CHLNCDRAFT_36694 [Chlorella variabilis]|eukprot:XP_005844948.1 hypothetical protein CHLNCDRAFT_36694 [Chlorella variabilis]